jgi:hypothetical protein
MDPRYPIGKFAWPETVTPGMRAVFVEDIAATPARLREAVRGLTDQQLDTPYREGGWTVRQVVHHVADSHLNMYVRLRLALTEEVPTIKPYDENKWAGLHDAKTLPVEVSLQLLESLHHRWVALMRSMPEGDFSRTFRHPEHGEVRLDKITAMYAWHGKHHAAHITGLRDRMSWK